MGERHKRLRRGRTAETVGLPFGAGWRRMETETKADTGGLRARRSWCMMIMMMRQKYFVFFTGLSRCHYVPPAD